MAEDREKTERDENPREIIQVLGTNRDNPEQGRIFVWTKRGWFERLQDASEGIVFEHVANSEDELMEYISRDNPSAELGKLGAKYRTMVAGEFSERSQSYQNAFHDWREEATDENENQEYHRHER